MQRALALLTLVLLPFLLHAQTDFKIDGARKVKMGYKPFPRDFKTESFEFASLESDCLGKIENGYWFDLQLKSEQVKFTVHTGGKFGDLVNPTIHLWEVKLENRERKIVEVCCVEHEGDDGAFSLEKTGLDEKGTYFVLVTGQSEGQWFAIEATNKFEPTVFPEQKEEEPAWSRIFGRVLDRDGKAKVGVKVSLMNESNEPLKSTSTDDRGVFTFEKLPRDEVYLTMIEAEDTDLKVEMFLLDDQGKIKNRSTRIGDKLYAFGADTDRFEELKLLTEDRFDLTPATGKVGVIGKVVDRETYLFGREGVKVGVYDKESLLLASSQTDLNGEFSILDLDDIAFDVKVESDPEKDYTEVAKVDDLGVPNEYSNSELRNEEDLFQFKALPRELVEMKRMDARDTQIKLPSDFSHMTVGSPIVLRNILFASGSAQILEASNPELDRLAEELTKQNQVRIEVSGHTDNQGNKSTNQMLSTSRAKAVVEALVERGVMRDRLDFKGFGDSKPVASNDTEEGRRHNRRVEFVVIE